MSASPSIEDYSDLLLNYSISLMEAGAHSSRVVRNASRIAQSLGLSVAITVFHKTVMMSVTDREHRSVRQTLIGKVEPSPINFRVISRLSTLSWRIHDGEVDFQGFVEKYHAILKEPRYSRWLVLWLVAVANASFCRLFQGDAWAMGAVFLATLAGFGMRQELAKRHVNHLGSTISCAFVSATIAGMATCLNLGNTPNMALATSVLYLIPGVPLINSVIDILQGFVMMGVSRMINACLLIICIALGLTGALMLLGVNTL